MPGTPHSNPRRRRRDAERNRAAILQAASDVLAELGANAGVDLIARRAGVGPATLYRHFATKDELVEAVLEQRVERLGDIIAATARVADPAEAFRALLHAIADVQIRDRSYRDLVAWRDRTADPEHPGILRLAALWAEALDRAHREGVLRDDVTAGDVALLMLGLDGVAGPAGARSPEALHRAVDLVADGLCASRSPLRGEPLDGAGLRAVAAAR